MGNIKEKFPEFFQDKIESKDLEKNSNNLIVLDTNFLLDIIQNPTNIAEKYIEALEMVKENIYIPYLVALEFNFRKSGIKKEKHFNINKYKDKVKTTLKKLKENISDHDLINIKKDTKEFYGELLNEINTFESKISNMLDEKIATAITEEENTIYKKLIDIIKDKVGEEYSQEWINEIEEEGENRYTNRIPPGFNDKAKEDTEEPLRRYNNICYQLKFGDLIIWKDIIEYSKKNTEIGSKVIYITNDGQSNKKSDLLYKVKDLIIGPHIYLMNELQKKSQKELYILSNLRFIKLVTRLSDSQIEEMELLTTKRNERLISRAFNDDFERIKSKTTKIKIDEYQRKIVEDREDKEILLKELELLKDTFYKDSNNYNLDKESIMETNPEEAQHYINFLEKTKDRYDILENEIKVIDQRIKNNMYKLSRFYNIYDKYYKIENDDYKY